MSNSYTDKLKMRIPAIGDQDWGDENNDNHQIVSTIMSAILAGNRVISGLVLSDGGGLDAAFSAGTAIVAGTLHAVSGSTITLTASSINYVYVNSSGVVAAATTPPTGDYAFLGIVDTASAAIDRLSDARYVMPLLDEDDMASDDPAAPASQQSVKAYVDNNAGIGVNTIIDGGCTAAQDMTPVNVSNTPKYGQVDLILASAAGTVSAGTITQEAVTWSKSGYAAKISGLTVTGSGTAVFMHRIPSKNVKQYINAAGVFSCKVYHDAGSAVDYTVTVNKANAEDDFSVVTQIATSAAAASVSSASATSLSLAVADLGACGNGIEIVVTGTCGAVTTKNFSISELKLEPGTTPTSFVPDISPDTKRFVRVDGMGINGVVYDATSINFGISVPEMIKTPTASLLTTSISIFSGTTYMTSSASAIAASTFDVRGARLRITGFTGLTSGAGVVCYNTSPPFKLDARL